MKSLLSIMALLCLATSALAADIVKASTKSSISISDTVHSSGESASALGFSHTTTLEVALIPGEAAGFNTDTLITGNFPLGPNPYFRLSEDPHYHTGATSVKISDTISHNRIEWKRSITMSWTDDSLKLVSKISAKPKLNDFTSTDWQHTVKSQFKTGYTDSQTVTLIAENDSTDVINISCALVRKCKASGSAKPGSKGVKVSSKQSSSGKFVAAR